MSESESESESATVSGCESQSEFDADASSESDPICHEPSASQRHSVDLRQTRPRELTPASRQPAGLFDCHDRSGPKEPSQEWVDNRGNDPTGTENGGLENGGLNAADLRINFYPEIPEAKALLRT
ncbi:hypothetical protein PICST_32285 [Scheffersomyces stipitis CBS 6054]|uniref:Uncharacterized protein n=1 Tax=Scheffersomyces stipitis (strain ATCC 58785 / CBS 6054 / NBRC 10063 / NRRL Y-11545) TaxID=322104 RepID=A3LVY2_PICST|nr:hypothetical protein PICST_32285 [Scheffersomyces stipitis CBS 6054]ABN67198.2 hypothetical protein PICST_32285 [Scheffersomyces stipitis CBS 6054]KAG2734843.1 hypothetical protein G9P44_002849 [Scheffersomyces stipitis]